jgi:hypothetical protein
MRVENIGCKYKARILTLVYDHVFLFLTSIILAPLLGDVKVRQKVLCL